MAELPPDKDLLVPGHPAWKPVAEAAMAAYHKRLDELDRTAAPTRPPSDADLPVEERIPRQMLVEVTDGEELVDMGSGVRLTGKAAEIAEAERWVRLRIARTFLREAMPNPFPDGPIPDYLGGGETQGFRLGQLGDKLSDRAHVDDGYRFHDALHLTFATMTGFSTVLRRMLNIRRCSRPLLHYIDDGPRALFEEERIFNSLGMHRAFKGGILSPNLDFFAEAEEARRDFSKVLEPGTEISLSDWKKAINVGTKLLTLLDGTVGGRIAPDRPPVGDVESAWIYLDLDRKAVGFSIDGPDAAKSAPPIQRTDKLFLPDGRLYGLD
jgi:hypothetical protein